MSKSITLAVAWSVPALVASVFLVTAAAQSKSPDSKKSTPDVKEEKEDLDQSKFMRKKLEASSSILEGLVSEKAESIIAGARALVEMSKAEKWQVKHDVMYRQFSNEFQRSAGQLLDEAEKQNFDAVALRWVDVTLKCIECHKFVRGPRLAAQ